MSDRQIDLHLHRAECLLRRGGTFLCQGHRKDARRCAVRARELLQTVSAGRVAQALRQFPKRDRLRVLSTVIVPRDPGVLAA